MIYKSDFLYIKISLAVIAIFSLVAINTSQAQEQGQEGGAYITSSHEKAQYYYPESCELWKILSGSFIERFDSLNELLEKYENRARHPNCVEEDPEQEETPEIEQVEGQAPNESEEDQTSEESEEDQNTEDAEQSQSEIVDGDLIQAIGDIDVYIVKIVGEKRFKRLILNPTIFDSYGHLEWENIKIVPESTLALYTTSALVQQINPDGSIADERVFQLFPGGDAGAKRHISLTSEEFVAAGGDWDSIYYINQVEAGNTFYSTGIPVNNMEDFKETLERQGQEIEQETIPVTEPVQGPESQEEPATVFVPQNDPEPVSGSGIQVITTLFLPSPEPTILALGQVQNILLSSYESEDGSSLGNRVVIEWDAVNNASGYEIRYRKSGESNWQTPSQSDFTITEENNKRKTDITIETGDPVSNPIFGMEYEFQVKAIGGGTGYQDGEFSSSQETITLLAIVSNINFAGTRDDAVTDTQISLTWSLVAGAERYEVQYCNAATSSDCDDPPNNWNVQYPTFTTQGTMAIATVTGLTAATPYEIRIRAIKGRAKGELSSPFSPIKTKLSRVTNVRVDQVADTEVRLSWDQADDAGTEPGSQGQLEGYDVRSVESDGSYTELPTGFSVATGQRMEGIVQTLSPGTDYTFVVRAKTGPARDDVGPWSGQVTFSTLFSAVENFRVVAEETTDVSIKLSWDALTRAARYEVKYCDATIPLNCPIINVNDNRNWISAPQSDPTQTTATLTGLTADTTYFLAVRGVDGGGTVGAWINNPLSHSTLLKAVGTVSASIRTHDAISLSWPGVTGVTGITEYEVRYCDASTPSDCDTESNWIEDGDASYNVTYPATRTERTAEVAGLTSATDYKFQVRAKTADKTGAWSRPQAHATKVGLVDRTTVRFTNIDNADPEKRAVRLTWGSVDRATGYEVEYKTGAGNYSSDNVTVTGTSADVIDLEPGTTYYFRVRAKKDRDEGAWTSPPLSHSTLIDIAGGLRADTRSTSAIGLSWDATTGATSYEVRYCSTQLPNGNAVDCATASNWKETGDSGYSVDYPTDRTQTTADVTGLTSGIEHIFQVKAKKSGLPDGEWSDELTHSTLLAKTSTPTLGTRDKTSVTINWSPATTGADSYQVRYKAAGGSWVEDHTGVTFPTTTSALITPLLSGTNYTFQVKAKKSGLPDGEWSDEFTTSTLLAKTSTPTLGTRTKTSITINWSPATTGATSYEVRYCDASTSSDCDIENNWLEQGDSGYSVTYPATVTETTATVTGLTAGTDYRLQVKAKKTGLPDGEWSDEFTHSTLLAKNSLPTLGTRTKTSITINWDAVTGATSYEVRYCSTQLPNGNAVDCATASNWKETGDSGYSVTYPATVTETTATVTSLTPGIDHKFQVRAKTNDIDGSWSEEFTASTLLAKTSTPTLGERTKTSITINWDAVTGADSYQVWYKAASGSWVEDHTGVTFPTTTSAAIAGLPSGTDHIFQVRAKKTGLPDGEWSDELTHSTLLAKTSTPTLGTRTKTSITINWSPATTGATSYEVRYCDASTPSDCDTEGNWIEDGDASYNVTYPATRTDRTATVTGLTAGTDYRLQVKAKKTGLPDGEWSEEFTASTLLAKTSTPTLGTRDKTSITINWSPATTGADSYQVRYKAAGGSWVEDHTGVTFPTTTSALIASLPSGTDHIFQVKAKKSGLPDGEWSDELTHSTLLAKTSTPTLETTSKTSITINWDAVTGADSYQVWYKAASGSWVEDHTGVTFPTTTSAAIAGLPSGTDHIFQVKAKKSGLPDGEWSDEFNTSTHQTLASPTGVTARKDTTAPTTQAIVSWTAAATGQGDIKYNVRHRIGAGVWSDPSADITGTEHTVTGLTPGSTYNFQVRSKDDNGASNTWVYADQQVVLNLGTTDDITFTPGATAGEVTVGWNAVAGGGTITYDLQFREGTRPWARITGISGTSRALSLTPGATYTFQVRAKRSNADAGEYYEETYTPGLGETDDITFTPGATAGEVTVGWNAVTGGGTITYDLQYRAGSGSWTEVNDIAGTSHEASLTPGATYTFQVRAKNAVDTGEYYEETYTPGLGETDDITFTPGANAGEVTVGWNAVTGGGTITYDLQYRAGSGSWTEVNDIAGTSRALEGITPGTEYTFQVRAKNAVDTGEYYEETYTLLQAVDGITTDRITQFQIHLSWNAITGATYRVEKETAGGDWVELTPVWGTQGQRITAQVTGLKPDLEYTLRVIAIKGGVEGIPSSSLTITTRLLPKPTNFSFSEMTDTSITLVWNEISVADGYEIQHRFTNPPDPQNNPWQDSTITDPTTAVQRTTTIITGLSSNTKYNFQVRAKQGTKYSEWSNAGSRLTLLARVGTIRLDSGRSAEDQITDTAIYLEWDKMETITEYELRHKTGDNPWRNTNVTITPPAQSESLVKARITGLTPGTVYQFRARSNPSGGNLGEWSDTDPPQQYETRLPAVGGIIFGTTTSTQVDLSWDEVDRATSYEVSVTSDDLATASNPTWTTTPITLDGTEGARISASITSGITATNTEYTFKVRAVKGTVKGVWSDNQEHSTLVSLGAVTDLQFGRTTDTEVNLSWVPVSGASEYEVRHCDTKLADGTSPGDCGESSDRWLDTNVTFPTPRGTRILAKVTGLTLGREYKFRVKAKAGSDSGPWSNPAGVSHSTLSVGTVTGLAASAPSTDFDKKVQLNWTAVTGATSYDVQYKTGSGSWILNTNVEFPSDRTDTTATVTDLNTYTEYQFRVRAKKGGATGAWSDPPVPRRTTVGKVGTINLASAGDEELTLRWAVQRPANGYDVQYCNMETSCDSEDDWDSATDFPLITTQFVIMTITGLDPGTEYKVRVRAKKGSARGPWSDPDAQGSGQPFSTTGGG